MQEWHLILNDSYELVVTCKDAEITRNGLGELTNIHWNGIKDNVPIKLDLSDCKCIYYKNLKSESPKERDTD